jgi:hypothetical protein
MMVGFPDEVLDRGHPAVLQPNRGAPTQDDALVVGRDLGVPTIPWVARDAAPIEFQ